MTALLTAQEAQKLLRVGKSTIYDLAKSREIASIVIGHKILFRSDDLEAFLRRMTRPAKKNFFGSHKHQHRGNSHEEQSNYDRQ